jgi:RsiW-degrading membrane proteinase PrsW (M82 family)
MRRPYWLGLLFGAMGLAAVVWSGLDTRSTAAIGLFVAAAGLPLAVMFAMSGRTNSPIPVGSLVAGGTLGPLTAVLGHVFVFAFAYAFFLGFAEAAVSLLDTFRIDPTLVDLAGSPWTLLLFFEVVVFAPFVEELGKGVAGWVRRPQTRSEAFMAGVAAGVGFAIVENVSYAVGALSLEATWEAIVIGRSLGAAVHPLASGLVVMGWWEWRTRRDAGLLARRFLMGVGVHALWNGSIVVLGIVGEAYGVDELVGFGALALVYAAGLGVVTMGVLWRVGSFVAADHVALGDFVSTDASAVGAWVVLASSLLIPIALLFLAYPRFIG